MTNKPLYSSDIANTLKNYGVLATQDLSDRINIYVDLLLRWGKKISLTTVTKPSEILRFHFGESLFAVSVAKIEKGRLADVGSGAGFPGLAIKLLVESLDVVLIESNAKKAVFLSEVTRELGLQGVEVFRGRMEDFDSGGRETNFITARALGLHEELLKWSHFQLMPTGKLIMWLGEGDSNSISLSNSWNWQKPVKIHETDRRFILIGSPSK